MLLHEQSKEKEVNVRLVAYRLNTRFQAKSAQSVGNNTGCYGGAIVAAPANKHGAEARDSALHFELKLLLGGLDNPVRRAGAIDLRALQLCVVVPVL
jgi:hypothetical protein